MGDTFTLLFEMRDRLSWRQQVSTYTQLQLLRLIHLNNLSDFKIATVLENNLEYSKELGQARQTDGGPADCAKIDVVSFHVDILHISIFVKTIIEKRE